MVVTVIHFKFRYLIEKCQAEVVRSMTGGAGAGMRTVIILQFLFATIRKKKNNRELITLVHMSCCSCCRIFEKVFN